MSRKREYKFLERFDRFTVSTIVILVLVISILFFPLYNLIEPDGVDPRIAYLFTLVTELIPTGIVFLTSYVVLRHVQDWRVEIQNEDLTTRIGDLITEQYEHLERFRRAGIVSAYEVLDRAELMRRISTSNRIRILHTWIYEPQELDRAFSETSRRNGDCSVQILLLNPNSIFAVQRSRDLMQPDDFVPNGIKATTKAFEEIRSRYKMKGLEVKYYDALPSLQLYICDNRALISMFLHLQLAMQSHQLDIELISRRGAYTHIGRTLDREFERIWKVAIPALPTFDDSNMDS